MAAASEAAAAVKKDEISVKGLRGLLRQAAEEEREKREFQRNYVITRKDVTLYKITGDMCSQSSIEESELEPLAMLIGGFKEGSCDAQGFTELESTEQVEEALLGKITVSYFRKKE